MTVARRLYFVGGDTNPNIEGVYKDAEGTPIPIAGYTIKLHIKYPTILVKIADLTTPANGEFEFTWEAGDLIAGVYDAEIEVTDDTGKIITAHKNSEGKRFQLVIDKEIN